MRTRSSPLTPPLTSAERRTLPLPFGSPAPSPAPPRPAKQLGLALPLGVADDQLVMTGCEDEGTSPHRIYRAPSALGPAAHEGATSGKQGPAGKDGAR